MEHLLATPPLHLINVQVEESENVATQIFVALLTSQSFWISFFHSSLSWVFDCVPPPSLVSVISSGVYETSDVSLMVRRALYIFNLLPPLYIRYILLLSRQHQHFKSHCGADKKAARSTSPSPARSLSITLSPLIQLMLPERKCDASDTSITSPATEIITACEFRSPVAQYAHTFHTDRLRPDAAAFSNQLNVR